MVYEQGQHITYVMGRNQIMDDLDFEFHGIILAVDGRYLKVKLTEPPFEGDVEWIVDDQVIEIESKTESKTLLQEYDSFDSI